ncbi:ATP-grasp domain-containing protein [Bernardetia sp. ABR2-2B]|uniref:ATP-grasp domain-containing protein n=1 Tax=Bernardetia sp. ABR2-2B TaxID=3127472 RepID=UPI0030CC7D81
MIDVYVLNPTAISNRPQLGAFTAMKGFEFMGAKNILVNSIADMRNLTNNTITDLDNKENIAVGGIGFVKSRLEYLGYSYNLESGLDYPIEIRSYLGREIWTSTIDEISRTLPNVFIKPKDEIKQKFFTGLVINSSKDLIGKGIQGQNYEVWCSELINPIAEFRVFVRYGEILDIRRYRGNYNINPDYKIIEKCIKDFTSSPLAYGIDFCVTEKGKTLLLEVNDGFSLGDYGLNFLDYAKLNYTRWSELVECKDYFKF